MAEYLTNDIDLKKVADAIRAKGGTSEQLVYPDGFAQAIAAIQVGGGGEACDECLTWSASSEFTVAPTVSDVMQGKVWDGTIEISYDKVSWEVWDGSDVITAKPHGNTYRFFMRGSGNHYISVTRVSGMITSPFRVSVVPGGVSVTGSIWTLLDWQRVRDGLDPTPDLTAAHVFSGLFAVHNISEAWMSRCPSLSPITVVSDKMFGTVMFARQVLLTTIPEIDYVDKHSPTMWKRVFFGLGSIVNAGSVFKDTTQGIYAFGTRGISGVPVDLFGGSGGSLVSGTRYCTDLEVV